MGAALAAGVQAGAGLIQTIGGLFQKRKAKKERKAAMSFFEENAYDAPESAYASLLSAENQASGVGLPAQDLYESRIESSTARGVGAAQNASTSSSEVLSFLSDLYSREQRAKENLAIEAANRFDRNQDILRGELNNMAGYEDQKYQYNVLMPFQQRLAYAGALDSQANQAISSGLGAIGGAAGGFYGLSSAENELAMLKQQAGNFTR